MLQEDPRLILGTPEEQGSEVAPLSPHAASEAASGSTEQLCVDGSQGEETY